MRFRTSIAALLLALIAIPALAQEQIGQFRNASGQRVNLQGVVNFDAAGNVVGAAGGSEASVGTNGAAAPTSSTQMGWLNGSGNLVATSAANPLPVSGTFFQATQPVSLASVPSHAVTNAGTFATQSAATQSGTWTVQPGNTPNTSPWLVTLNPAASGGVSTYSANVTTAGAGAGVGGVAVSAAPGQIYNYMLMNNNASVCYIQWFDVAQATVNLGTTAPKMSIGIPANGGANLAFPNGIPFATAVTIAVTTTRAGSTACGTGLDINIGYKG